MRVLYQVDAFTRTPFSGNPAGVALAADGLTDMQMLAVARELNNSETAFVLPPDGLTDMQMLAVARELNNSETAFVLPPDGTDHDLRVRFFTPTTEVPSCGHATVATHFARAVKCGLPSGSLVQKTGTGLLQRVRIHRNGDRARICMHQGAAVFGPELDSLRVGRLLRALGAAPPRRPRGQRPGPDRVHGTRQSPGRTARPRRRGHTAAGPGRADGPQP
ncbi:PhzF family phenazine biosynthesis isomerase [Streptomyces sp. NPDC059637]|uniref:PhzF family phenazine biosynthesis isomerase n=1 Tax=Streptomyces sp. NPDC059637 TaxID=3347752 RepID=UPI0036B9920B